jgi:hypothetical protein
MQGLSKADRQSGRRWMVDYPHPCHESKAAAVLDLRASIS